MKLPTFMMICLKPLKHQELGSLMSLQRYSLTVLNSYLRPYDDRKLSNSFTENVNGNLRTYLAVSRGISNFNRFRKRVIYSLSKDVQYSLNNSLHSDSVPKRKRGTYKKIRE